MRISQQLARRRYLIATIPIRRRRHQATSRMQRELVELTTRQLVREHRDDRRIAAAERIGRTFARDMGLG